MATPLKVLKFQDTEHDDEHENGSYVSGAAIFSATELSQYPKAHLAGIKIAERREEVRTELRRLQLKNRGGLSRNQPKGVRVVPQIGWEQLQLSDLEVTRERRFHKKKDANEIDAAQQICINS